MWERVDLKNKAKAFLSKYYIQAFFVSLLLMIISGSNSGRSSGSNNTNVSQFKTYQLPQIHIGFFDWVPVIWGLSIFLFLVAITVVISIRIFLGFPLEVGGRKFFLRGAEGDVDFKHITSTFDSDGYMDIVKTMLYKNVLNFLFYLLFIIPGIMKSYAYAMVPYILSDNPHIGHARAIELSESMTSGQKWNMFVLDLSFIGWYLLGSLLFGLGVLFVNPYVDATKAQLYFIFRENAIKYNLCVPDELSVILQEVDEEHDDWYRYE